jgi:hypothetical protein
MRSKYLYSMHILTFVLPLRLVPPAATADVAEWLTDALSS